MKRLLPGLALALCWLLLLLVGSFPVFWLVTSGLGLLCGYEYLRMAMPDDTDPSALILLTLSFAFPLFLAGLFGESGVSGGLFLSLFLCVCYVLSHYSALKDSYTTLCRLIFGATYIGFLAGHLLLLYDLPEGNLWLIILVGITAGSDSGAYYCGRKFGKRKLCPNVSPNKTVEGAVGGVVSGVIIAMLCSYLLLGSTNWIVLIPMAILLSVVGIVGDLCESIVKRGTDTKDSGKILLGHGGVLDRVDSLLLAAPLLYYLLTFTG